MSRASLVNVSDETCDISETLPGTRSCHFYCRVWFFFFSAAQYTQVFLPLILNQSFKFSPKTIGLTQGLRLAVSSIAANTFHWICDGTTFHREMLIVAQVCYYSCTLLLCHVQSPLIVIAVVMLRQAFSSGCDGMVHNFAFATIEHAGVSQDGYGSLKLWGSIGWGAACFVGTFLSDHVFKSNLFSMFYVEVLLGCVVCIFLTFCIHPSYPVVTHRKGRHRSLEYQWISFASPTDICIISLEFVHGVILGVTQTTTFLFFKSLNISTTGLGISAIFTCFAEVAVYSYEQEIWEQFRGVANTMHVSSLVSMALLILFYFVQYAQSRAIAAVSTTALNNGNNALFHTSSIQKTTEATTDKNLRKIQNIIHCFLNDVAAPSIGCIISGFAVESVHPASLYILAALFQLLGVAMPFLLNQKASVTLGSTHEAVVTNGRNQPDITEEVPILGADRTQVSYS